MALAGAEVRASPQLKTGRWPTRQLRGHWSHRVHVLQPCRAVVASMKILWRPPSQQNHHEVLPVLRWARLSGSARHALLPAGPAAGAGASRAARALVVGVDAKETRRPRLRRNRRLDSSRIRRDLRAPTLFVAAAKVQRRRAAQRPRCRACSAPQFMTGLWTRSTSPARPGASGWLANARAILRHSGHERRCSATSLAASRRERPMTG